VNNKLTCGAPRRHGGGGSKPLQRTPPQLPRAVSLDELISRGRQRRRAQQPRAPGFQVLLAVVVAASTERRAPMKRRPSAAAVIVVRRRPLVKEQLDLYVRRAPAEGRPRRRAGAQRRRCQRVDVRHELYDRRAATCRRPHHRGRRTRRARLQGRIVAAHRARLGWFSGGREAVLQAKSLPNAMWRLVWCMRCLSTERRWISGKFNMWGARLARGSVGWFGNERGCGVVGY
jgi:hypothetical protein